MQNTPTTGVLDKVEAKKPESLENKNVYMLQVSQFELTKALYTSELFSKIDLTSSAKLFLWALCTHYNPKNKSMFPAQSTVAKKLGISEKSAQRAVKELKNAGLIEYVTKGVNHYNFSAKFFDTVKMSCKMGQNVLNGVGQNVLQTNNHEKKKNKSFSNFNFNKRMTPNAQETKKLIEERETIRAEGFNPYEYEYDDALCWLKSTPGFWISKSHLAKTLVEKYRFKEFLYLLDV